MSVFRSLMSVSSLALGLAFAASVRAAVETQMFDSAASAAAAGWAGNLNQEAGPPSTNFGWSNTSNAGGAAGEAGGLFKRLNNSYYADTTIGTVSAATDLTASGRITIATFGTGDPFLFLGWFKEGLPASTVLGIRILDGSPSARSGAAIGTNSPNGGSSGSGFKVLPASTPILFTVTWDADGGNGNGSVFAEFRLASDNSLIFNSFKDNLPGAPAGDANFQTMDRFGIVALGNSTANGAQVWFDNVTYTSNDPIPEPASLALLGVGALCLTRRRWA